MPGWTASSPSTTRLRQSLVPDALPAHQGARLHLNAWSDGKRRYRPKTCRLDMEAMLAAAASNPAIKARTDFYLHRVPEEFYIWARTAASV